MASHNDTDDLFTAEKTGDEPFRFDASVARVFPDMLRRSIPGYAASLEAIGSLAGRHVGPGTLCYDLGCSLGAASLAMRQGIRVPGCRIIAVDNAPAMIERCRRVVAEDASARSDAAVIDVVLGDICDLPLEPASMIVMNYTLQFVEPGSRGALAARIADALDPGGLLVLSEKVVDEDPAMEQLLVALHHEHKRRNAYSELEISRKRVALENVLVPESVAAHEARLRTAGFRHVAVWLRHFNFVSMIALR